MSDTKRCTRCGDHKPLDAFYTKKDARRPGKVYRSCECIECSPAARAERAASYQARYGISSTTAHTRRRPLARAASRFKSATLALERGDVAAAVAKAAEATRLAHAALIACEDKGATSV
jgi:hypothetical protein